MYCFQACKRRKSSTLEAAVSAGLALLGESKTTKKKFPKPAHFHLVKSGTNRQTHTPYRPRVKARTGNVNIAKF